MKNLIKQKFIIDSVLNIIASLVPIIFLQLIALPLINRNINNADKYGLIITIISLITMTSRTYGNTLNNVRLILNKRYCNDNDEGDFNILLLWGCFIITGILTIILYYFYNINDIISIILIVLISITLVLKEYLIVAFRLELSYKKILINNLILVTGYVSGYFVFIITGYWQTIYIVGQLLSLCYIIKNSNLLRERFKTTNKFREATYKTLLLTTTSFLSMTTSYADKILLYPLLGGSVVAVYYSSTLLGRIVSLSISPISSVLLSYLSRKTKISTNTFYSILITSMGISIVGYFAALLIGEPVLSLIYPEYAVDAVTLIPITSASAMVSLIIAMINPIVMKFKNINWQLYINIQHLILYIILSVNFTRQNGVVGFSVAILITLIIKLLSLILIYVFSKSAK